MKTNIFLMGLIALLLAIVVRGLWLVYASKQVYAVKTGHTRDR
jgi:hypothetical protein